MGRESTAPSRGHRRLFWISDVVVCRDGKTIIDVSGHHLLCYDIRCSVSEWRISPRGILGALWFCDGDAAGGNVADLNREVC